VSAPHGRGENALRRWCRGVGVLGSFGFAQGRLFDFASRFAGRIGMLRSG